MEADPDHHDFPAFLLNHSFEYGAAALFSWIEYWLEVALLPQVKLDTVSAIGKSILGAL